MKPKIVPELNITNLQKSLKFYTKILGFTIKYKRDEEDFAYLTLNNEIDLMLDGIHKGRTWKTGEFEHPFGRGINFQIEVDSIEPILKRIKEKNLKLYLEVEEKWYETDSGKVGNKQFLIQDPDGYLLRFFEEILEN